MERIKVTMSRPRFIHNGRVTICRMSVWVKELDELYHVTGVSKCREEDEYNERIGNMISQARAEIKARNIAKLYAREMVKSLEDQLSGYKKFIEEIDKFNSHDKEAILKVTVEE